MLNTLGEYFHGHSPHTSVASLSGSWGSSLPKGLLFTFLRAEGMGASEPSVLLESQIQVWEQNFQYENGASQLRWFKLFFCIAVSVLVWFQFMLFWGQFPEVPQGAWFRCLYSSFPRYFLFPC